MGTSFTKPRRFAPGTTGWTVEHLAARAVDRRWCAGRYEIIEGILTTLPPALPGDLRLQEVANAQRGQRDLRYDRLLVPPTLVIESISLGHEAHDEETKLRWYEEFGVPNYWMLNAYAKTLRCLVLDNGKYRVDRKGENAAELRPSLFPELIIPLKDLWA